MLLSLHIQQVSDKLEWNLAGWMHLQGLLWDMILILAAMLLVLLVVLLVVQVKVVSVPGKDPGGSLSFPGAANVMKKN